jgi:hypothetical protein
VTAVKPSNRWLYVLVAALLALSVAVQVGRDRGWQPYQPANPLLWIQSGPLLKRLALGFENLMADVYWMRAVVYYGGQRRTEGGKVDYLLLHPLLDLVTTLDPHFRVAYRFGAIFLTEAYPNGPGRPDLAISLLERALAADGPSWEYMQDIGFIHFWWLRDYARAAEWFQKAADAPNGPLWLRPLAATTLAVGGDRDSARVLWRQLAEHTEAAWVRDTAVRRLLQLDALDALDQLNASAARFEATTGRRPRSWQELVAGERLRGIPLDPAGTPFELDAATGRIDLAPGSPLWPIPKEMLPKAANP